MDVPSITVLATLCSLSTLTLRICGYVFLRWIPGHVFPPIIFTVFVIYASTFGVLYLSKSAYRVVASASDITIVDHEPVETNGVTSDSAPNASETDGLLASDKHPPTIEATETVVYERKDPHPLRTLLLGTPAPLNPKLSLITFALNALIALASWDLTFRSTYFYPAKDLSFSRVGYVGPNTAKLLVREPRREHWPVAVWYQAAVPGITDTHLVDSIPWLTNETDYTQAITIPRLSPETKYRYYTSSNHTGVFTTAPAPGTAPSTGKFSFLTSSCIKARFPYNPLEHPLAIPGLRTVKSVAKELKAAFMLFLGDFIYIDVPRRPGSDVDSYREEYRQVYASPDWASASENLPWLQVFDDHEVANDWDQGKSGVYQAAITPFREYQHAVNPPPLRPTGETYYTFSWGSSASFFLLDTRTYRSHNNAPDGPDKTMLGAQQRQDLLNWLSGPASESQWKIIVSSVPFTKNWRFGGNDTWAGFLWERQRILETAWGIGGRSGVVVLSGDRHEFAATRLPPPENSRFSQDAAVHEFSCSPLSQFYLPIRTYKQTDRDDQVIKYIPDGNHKFGAVTIDTTNEEQAVLKYQLYLDGEEEWSWVLTAPARGKPERQRNKLWT